MSKKNKKKVKKFLLPKRELPDWQRELLENIKSFVIFFLGKNLLKKFLTST